MDLHSTLTLVHIVWKHLLIFNWNTESHICFIIYAAVRRDDGLVQAFNSEGYHQP